MGVAQAQELHGIATQHLGLQSRNTHILCVILYRQRCPDVTKVVVVVMREEKVKNVGMGVCQTSCHLSVDM